MIAKQDNVINETESLFVLKAESRYFFLQTKLIHSDTSFSQERTWNKNRNDQVTRLSIDKCVYACGA